MVFLTVGKCRCVCGIPVFRRRAIYLPTVGPPILSRGRMLKDLVDSFYEAAFITEQWVDHSSPSPSSQILLGRGHYVNVTVTARSMRNGQRYLRLSLA